MSDSNFIEVHTTRKLSELKADLLRDEINKSEDYTLDKKDSIKNKAVNNEDTVVISLSDKLKNKLDKRDNNV